MSDSREFEEEREGVPRPEDGREEDGEGGGGEDGEDVVVDLAVVPVPPGGADHHEVVLEPVGEDVGVGGDAVVVVPEDVPVVDVPIYE